MELMLLGARLLLAVVFGAAGVAKIIDRNGARHAMRDFGMAGAAGLGLPVLELAIALSLIAGASAWWGAVTSLVVLAALVSSGAGDPNVIALAGWQVAPSVPGPSYAT